MEIGFFPFPYVWRGERSDGSLRPWPAKCVKCGDRECETSTRPGIQLCKYGLNFERIDKDFLVAGVVLNDWQYSTPARKHRRQQLPVVPNTEFSTATTNYRTAVRDRKR